MTDFMTAREHDDDSLIVSERHTEAAGLISLKLRRASGKRLPDWTPGAHIDLILDDGTIRQYSLCGDPFDSQTYRIGVLREADGRGGSARIHDHLQIGDQVRFGGPRNNFALVPAPHYSFVAGGIGITPLLPMLRMAEQVGAQWRLLYLGRSRSTMAFLGELDETNDRIAVHPADELGRFDLAGWLAAAPQDSKLYVCGPNRLLDAIDESTREWRRGWVRAERFTALDCEEPARTTSFDVELSESGLIITVDTDISIATALRAAGVPVLTSCGQGVCGTCETTVLQGQPDHRDSLLTDAERSANNCMFVCVSRSLSDRLVLAL